MIADRSSGAQRHLAVPVRTLVLTICSALVLPILIGFGAAWKAKSDVASLQASHTALELENANYRAATDPRVRRRTASLEDLVRPLPPRNLLIGRMTCELLEVLESFDASGLALLRGEWESLHAHAGHRIRLRLADGSVVSGIHTGVADDGALRVRTREGVRALHSARVLSARPA